MMATGKKMKIGVQAQIAGRICPKKTSVAKSSQIKTTRKQLSVVKKLIKIAVFMALGSRFPINEHLLGICGLIERHSPTGFTLFRFIEGDV